jgi:cytochrome c5
MKVALLSVVVVVALLGVGPAAAADGKEVYTKSCALCHASLPPKLGDKAAWEPRIKQGVDAMVAAVVKGKGTMPPKGGNASLTEPDIKAAVEYMISQVK